MGSRGGPRGGRAAVLLALVLLGFGAVLVAAASATGETGAPALEGDGVWRARGNWEIGEGETAVHTGERLEALGNVTLAANATLSLVNTTAAFLGDTLTAGAGALVTFQNVTATGSGGFAMNLSGAILDAASCTLRFEGNASGRPSINVADGAVALTDCQVQTDAAVALAVFATRVETLDCDFVTLAGEAADVLVDGRGEHIFDTTRFGTLQARDKPAVRLFATVRFFPVAVGGAPVAAQVNGSGVFGELFTVETAPGAPAALRVLWYRDDALAVNLTQGVSRGPSPLTLTALNRTVGGNNSDAWITHHRENITVVLDGLFDLALAPLRIADRGVDGPPLKRAFYMELGEDVALVIEVENRGATTSPASQVVLTRRTLNPSSWTASGDPEAVATFEVPALAPAAVWETTFVLHADSFGGPSHSTTPCTQTNAFTSEYRTDLIASAPGDFASWNDARQFDALVYSVEPVSGPECFKPNDSVLPVLGAAFVALVGAAAVMSYYFSESQVAKRAARAAGEPKPPPPPP